MVNRSGQTWRTLLVGFALFAANSGAWGAAWASSPNNRQDNHPAFDVRAFCSAVDAQILTANPSSDWVLYLYQDMLVYAAGVQPDDGTEEVAFKMRSFFSDHMNELVCSTPNFVPTHGNVIKLAIARQNSDFVTDLIAWGVNLNQIDSIDGMTVLDYVRLRQEQAGRSPWGQTLRRYYERLRAAGARHANELLQ